MKASRALSQLLTKHINQTSSSMLTKPAVLSQEIAAATSVLSVSSSHHLSGTSSRKFSTCVTAYKDWNKASGLWKNILGYYYLLPLYIRGKHVGVAM